MREEYEKSKKEVDGVAVSDLGDEYVFSLEDKNGKKIEYHLTKPHMNELEDYIKEKKLGLENKK